jgi:hypothetical protein
LAAPLLPTGSRDIHGHSHQLSTHAILTLTSTILSLWSSKMDLICFCHVIWINWKLRLLALQKSKVQRVMTPWRHPLLILQLYVESPIFKPDF